MLLLFLFGELHFAGLFYHCKKRNFILENLKALTYRESDLSFKTNKKLVCQDFENFLQILPCHRRNNTCKSIVHVMLCKYYYIIF